jgi:hypothetical protein
MFIATNHPLKYICSLGSEMSFQLASAPGCCTSSLNSRMSNDKWKNSYFCFGGASSLCRQFDREDAALS